MESALEHEFEAWDAGTPLRWRAPRTIRTPRHLAGSRHAKDARRFLRGLEQGQAFARIHIPRIGVETVVVHGTRWGADLTRGPGHYERTTVPGLGKTVGIAGHRTTFGAPFRKIDKIQVGDEITLEMPYATFRYRVFQHEIVDEKDWSVIRNRGFDTLMLSAAIRCTGRPSGGSSTRAARLRSAPRGRGVHDPAAG